MHAVGNVLIEENGSLFCREDETVFLQNTDAFNVAVYSAQNMFFLFNFSLVSRWQKVKYVYYY